MTTIIGFSARKQGGKNTACNFILGYTMSSLGIVRGSFDINKDGQLHITDLFGNDEHEGVFDYFRQGKAMDDFKAKYLDKYIKIYSFADMLKRDVCMNILGLSYDQVYGPDESKNSETKIKWSQCPGVLTKALNENVEHEEVVGRLGSYYEKLDGIVYHEDGFMTAREVMQYVGTEVFRRMVPDCWAEGTIRKILQDGPGIALVCDCRFPNEVKVIQNAEGIVVRLTRNEDIYETHASEISLDGYDGFDVIIDNKNMSITEQNQHTYNLLASMGLIEEGK